MADPEDFVVSAAANDRAHVGEEALREPRSVPWWGWTLIVLAGLAVVVSVAIAREHPERPPSVVPSASESAIATGPAAAPALPASDRLVGGLAGGVNTAPGRLTFEADLQNVTRSALRVEYPIKVVGLERRALRGARAGVYSNSSVVFGSAGDLLPERLTTIKARSTVALVVRVPPVCGGSRQAEQLWTEASLRAVIKLASTPGSATFQVDDGEASYSSLQRQACAGSPPTR